MPLGMCEWCAPCDRPAVCLLSQPMTSGTDSSAPCIPEHEFLVVTEHKWINVKARVTPTPTLKSIISSITISEEVMIGLSKHIKLLHVSKQLNFSFIIMMWWSSCLLDDTLKYSVCQWKVANWILNKVDSLFLQTLLQHYVILLLATPFNILQLLCK